MQVLPPPTTPRAAKWNHRGQGILYYTQKGGSILGTVWKISREIVQLRFEK
jgi:hypothetical protein